MKIIKQNIEKSLSKNSLSKRRKDRLRQRKWVANNRPRFLANQLKFHKINPTYQKDFYFKQRLLFLKKEKQNLESALEKIKYKIKILRQKNNDVKRFSTNK